MPWIKEPEPAKRKSRKDENFRLVYNTRRWKKLRKEYMERKGYLCEECLAEDKWKVATECHHIIPFAAEQDLNRKLFLAFNPNNLQALCEECHRKKHEKEYERY